MGWTGQRPARWRGPGLNLVLLVRSADDLARTAAQVQACGRQALAVPVDLAEADQILAGAQQTIARFGRIDMVVNAAGPTHLVRSPSYCWTVGSRAGR